MDTLLGDIISIQTEDLRVPERDFLRYSPDFPSNPLGLPFYTEALTSELKNIISPYIPITNATVISITSLNRGRPPPKTLYYVCSGHSIVTMATTQTHLKDLEGCHPDLSSRPPNHGPKTPTRHCVFDI